MSTRLSEQDPDALHLNALQITSALRLFLGTTETVAQVAHHHDLIQSHEIQLAQLRTTSTAHNNLVTERRLEIACLADPDLLHFNLILRLNLLRPAASFIQRIQLFDPSIVLQLKRSMSNEAERSSRTRAVSAFLATGRFRVRLLGCSQVIHPVSIHNEQSARCDAHFRKKCLRETPWPVLRVELLLGLRLPIIKAFHDFCHLTARRNLTVPLE